MEPSEELRRVVHRFLTALRDCDADASMAKVSAHPGPLTIGTASEEWWYPDDSPVKRRQLEEMDGFPLEWDEIEAWEEGTVGWAALQATLGGPDGRVPVRMTLVLHLEQAESWPTRASRFATAATSS